MKHVVAAIIVVVILGIGLFCSLLYRCAVYALPVYVGLVAGFGAIHTGAGAIGGAIVAVVAGALVLTCGQVIFALARWPALRLLVALVFAVPATLAGYSIVRQLWTPTMPPTVWRFVFGVAAAVAAGSTAVARLTVGPSRPPVSR